MQQLKYPVYFKPKFVEKFKSQILLDGVRYHHSRTQVYIDKPNKKYYQCAKSSKCGRIISTEGFDDFKLSVLHKSCNQRCPSGHRVNEIQVFQIDDIKGNMYKDPPIEFNEGVKPPIWSSTDHLMTLLFCDKTDREAFFRIRDCNENTVGDVIKAIARKNIVVKGGIEFDLKNFFVMTNDGTAVYDY
jgi:hypothetical protein